MMQLDILVRLEFNLQAKKMELIRVNGSISYVRVNVFFCFLIRLFFSKEQCRADVFQCNFTYDLYQMTEAHRSL